jgi:hypothetical protein
MNDDLEPVHLPGRSASQFEVTEHAGEIGSNRLREPCFAAELRHQPLDRFGLTRSEYQNERNPDGGDGQADRADAQQLGCCSLAAILMTPRTRSRSRCGASSLPASAMLRPIPATLTSCQQSGHSMRWASKRRRARGESAPLR